MAAKLLSADVVSFDAAASSTTKGETLRDNRPEHPGAQRRYDRAAPTSASGSPLYLRPRARHSGGQRG